MAGLNLLKGAVLLHINLAVQFTPNKALPIDFKASLRQTCCLSFHSFSLDFSFKNMANILVINGPNLNLLGDREPDQYGSTSLEEITSNLDSEAKKLGHQLSHFQSNAEAELINRIHEAKSQETAFIIINPAAYTHTSVALRDALSGVNIPFIEVHLSNVHARESFRKESYFSRHCARRYHRLRRAKAIATPFKLPTNI